ncbi:hypothetical protein CI109_105811 [Kwoniella shandongensis]|uniref:Uncharacterized protein n=1 Tax=Kwoniella shandongensis TaxID=1734106 RepID=A0A5M6C0D5_9TREE|nr:uncharacterized protein CI109_003150 [Kwoniella shandongensis]KAA5528618.1 hypothetical protein CI109_003150 [Kwoniella shandongensis]
MEDYVKSGFGAESTDETISVAQNKPVWHLAPLPFTQVRQYDLNFTTRRHVQSLHSYCLASISRNFDLFTPHSFVGLSPVLLKRIFSRIRVDRGYEDEQLGSRAFNPDEATVWGYSALSDPEETNSTFDLAISMWSILAHLAPNPISKHPEHPFVELPKLYATLQPSSPISFLTTLSLDGMDEVVNDQNVLALRWCTHLTALWMKGARVSDASIRLLASALELPGDEDPKEGRGMWRLRAWSLNGCKGVSDRSMKSLARWPGLVMLDVRETSCTTTGIEIFNRFSNSLFSNYNAEFQPCTDGLLPLFARNLPPSTILDNLCMSLIKSPTSAESSQPRSTRNHISLHLSSTTRPIPVQYLPEPPFQPAAVDYKKKFETDSSRSVYRGNGVGQIYGTSVSKVEDEVRSFRGNLKIALRLQSQEEAFEKMTPAEKRKKTMAEKKEREEWKRLDKEWYKSERKEKAKIFKDTGANDRSKRFVKGKGKSAAVAALEQSSDEGEEEEGDCERKLMMVRMVNNDWDRLKWTLGGGGGISAPTSSSGSTFSWSRSQKAARVSSNLLDEIISTTKRPAVATSPTPTTSMFRPTSTPKSVQSISRSSLLGSSPVQPSSTPKSSNPFRQASQSSTGRVRPLFPSSQSSHSVHRTGILPQASQSSISATQVFSQSQGSAGGPQSHRGQDNVNTNNDAEDGLSFSSTSRKRTFGGGGTVTGAEGKRRGMKMFSLGSGKT